MNTGNPLKQQSKKSNRRQRGSSKSKPNSKPNSKSTPKSRNRNRNRNKKSVSGASKSRSSPGKQEISTTPSFYTQSNVDHHNHAQHHFLQGPELEAYLNTNKYGDQTRRIIKDMIAGTFICVICLDPIRSNQKIWSACNKCHNVLHLGCVTNWSTTRKQNAISMAEREHTSNISLIDLVHGSSPMPDFSDIQFSWTCPSCQSLQHTEPTKSSFCFCGSTVNPPPSIIPHACDSICSKVRACGHSCSAPCHPGRCPPCDKLGQAVFCPCGKSSTKPPCTGLAPSVSPVGPVCGQICGKTLCSLNHTCPIPCHLGPCPPCPIPQKQSCFCGKVTKISSCGSSTSAESVHFSNGIRLAAFSCHINVCDKLLSCGNHHCISKCHRGDCSPCSSSPDFLTSCCCGKTPVELLPVRTTCLDPLPICNQVCGKPLLCGNGEHTCSLPCHPGKCPSCTASVSVTCPCGSCLAPEPMKCQEITNYSSRLLDMLLTSVKQQTSKSMIESGAISENSISTLAISKNNGGSPNIIFSLLEQFPPPFSCSTPCSEKKICGRHNCTQKCCPFKVAMNILVPVQKPSSSVVKRKKRRQRSLSPQRQTKYPDAINPLISVLSVLSSSSNTALFLATILHTCIHPCNNVLDCGYHRCTKQCHPRKCEACYRTSRDPLLCECGLTSLEPPIACGTHEPRCPFSCKIERQCGHPPNHNCHSTHVRKDPKSDGIFIRSSPYECPPCRVLVSKPCIGSHTTLSNIPCHTDPNKIKCGTFCNISLDSICKRPTPHQCPISCHNHTLDFASPTSFHTLLQKGAISLQRIFKTPLPSIIKTCLVAKISNVRPNQCPIPCFKRKKCDHPCIRPCIDHTEAKGDICNQEPCLFPVTVYCTCGRFSKVVPCGAHAMVPRIEFCECDDDCIREERSRKFADALGLNLEQPSNSAHLDEIDNWKWPKWSETVLTYYKTHPRFIQNLERILLDFCSFKSDTPEERGRKTREAHKAGQTFSRPSSSSSYSFPPMPATKRKIIFEFCKWFGLEARTQDPEPNTFVSIFSTPNSFPPPITVSELRKIFPNSPAQTDLMKHSDRLRCILITHVPSSTPRSTIEGLLPESLRTSYYLKGWPDPSRLKKLKNWGFIFNREIIFQKGMVLLSPVEKIRAKINAGEAMDIREWNWREEDTLSVTKSRFSTHVIIPRKLVQEIRREYKVEGYQFDQEEGSNEPDADGWKVNKKTKKKGKAWNPDRKPAWKIVEEQNQSFGFGQILAQSISNSSETDSDSE